MEVQSLIIEPGHAEPTLVLPVTGNFTPQQIATAYNIPNNSGLGVKIGIISYGGGWLQSDIDKSMADLGLPSPTIKQVLLNGATNNFNMNDGNYSLENTLDIFCVAGMVPAADITIYIGNNSVNLFNRAIDDGCDVITHSWAYSESSGDFLATVLYKAAINNVTVLTGSGDWGSTNTSHTLKGVCYPASSANIIAVGGTTLTLNPDGSRKTETGNSDSGGGISSIVPAPIWQQGLTYKTYNSSTKTYGPVTALTTRGVPDISAPYTAYAFYANGVVQVGVGGTSASTPIMAGMIARFISLNGRRPRWMLPTFYQNQTSAFTNISDGNNASHNTEGYAVTTGWDAVTGLGAPIGQTLYSKLRNPPLGAVKNSAGEWAPIKGVYAKFANGWWPIKDVWVKTSSGWQRPN